VAFGDQARAESLYELLRPYPNHNTPNGFGFYMGSVSHFLGLLAKLLGRAGDAARHFERALANNERLGCLPQVARTQVALAELLAEQPGRAARLRTNALLSDAATTARRLEMSPLVTHVDRLRSRLAVGSGGSRARAR
jgi:hypothetical protein